MPGDPNGSRAQQAAYYQQFIAKIPGHYTGDNAKFKGKTWVQIYQAWLKQFPDQSPKDIGDKVVGLWAAQTEADKIAAAAGQLGPFTTSAEQGIEKAAGQFAWVGQLTDPIRAIAEALAGVGGGIAAFYDAVTDGKLWRSVGWLLLGLVLLIIGITLWIGPSAVTHGPTGVVARGIGKATA